MECGKGGGGWGALFDICGVGSPVLEAIGGTPRLPEVWGPSVEAGAPGAQYRGCGTWGFNT